MDIAREFQTNELIEAEDLPFIKNIELIIFVCPDHECNIRLSPCSYSTSNKVRPYFKKAKQNEEHSENCTCFIELKGIKKGKKQSVKNEVGIYPYHYPNKLNIDTLTPITTQISDVESDKNNEKLKNNNQNNVVSNSHKRNRSVTTIKQIVNQYINFPYDRDLEIQLPFIGETKYKFAFKQISYRSHNLFKGFKIYYGKVHIAQDIEIINGIILIRFFVCERWENNKPINSYMLEINTTNWSKNQIAKLLNKIEYTKNEYFERYKSKENTLENAYIFILADAPSIDSPFLFKVNNPKLIEPVFVEITHPKIQ